MITYLAIVTTLTLAMVAFVILKGKRSMAEIDDIKASRQRSLQPAAPAVSQPPASRTPSQAAFADVLDAIPGITHRFAVFGDEPTEVIEGPLDRLETVRRAAEAAGLYVSYAPLMKRLEVHGFGQLRNFASFSFCSRCNGELTLTRERTSGICASCAGKVRS